MNQNLWENMDHLNPTLTLLFFGSYIFFMGKRFIERSIRGTSTQTNTRVSFKPFIAKIQWEKNLRKKKNTPNTIIKADYKM